MDRTDGDASGEPTDPDDAERMVVELIIPAYNEEGNLRSTVERIAETLDDPSLGWDYAVKLVVSDGSTDDTPAIADELAARYGPVSTLHRTTNPGFGNAIKDGLAASRADVMIPFMADLSDDPADVIGMVEAIQAGYDVVYGSRFVEGGSVEGYPPIKLLYNRAFNNVVRLAFGIRAKDVTNAFTAYRREVIEEIDPTTLRAESFDITAELPLQAHILGFSSTEVPVSWRGREVGVSKLDATRKGPTYARRLAEMFVVGNLASLKDLFGAVVDQSPGRVVGAGLLGVLLLVGLFSLAGFSEVFGIVSRASPVWVGAAAVAYLSSFVFRTWRWRVLLRSAGHLASIGGVFRTLLFGWFLNFILPARIGDLGRGVALKSTERVPFSVGTGTVVIERALDMSVLGGAMLLLVAAQAGGGASSTVLGVGALGIAGGLAVGLAVAYYLPEWVLERVEGVSTRLGAGLETLSEALQRVAGNPAGLALALLVSVPVWVLEASTILFSARALSVELAVSNALVTAITAFVAQSLPLTPAGLGTYETTIAATLSLFGVATETGTALALADHFARIAVVMVVGAICTIHIGFRSREYFRGLEATETGSDATGSDGGSGSGTVDELTD
jgi:hypothetical protein